jgi:hypothetical protein
VLYSDSNGPDRGNTLKRDGPVFCHHNMACHDFAEGGKDLEMWRVTVNVLNKESRAADKG